MANNVDSDTTLVVDSTALSEACSEWNTKISSVDLSSIDINGTFSALIDSGVGINYFPSLKTALERADKLAKNISKLIDLSASNQEAEDKKSSLVASNNSYGNAIYDRSNSGSSAVSSAAAIDTGNYIVTEDNKENNANIEVKDETKAVELDNIAEDETVESLSPISNEKQQEKVSEIDISKVKETLLTSINTNGSYKEVMGNIDDISKVKEVLLSSPNISDDLKENLLNMDENELKTVLYDILVSGELFSDFSKSIITIFDKELKNNFKNASVYDSADIVYKVYDFVAEEKDFQDQIKEIYFGVTDFEFVDEKVITITRSFVDFLASANHVTYEEILKEKKYQKGLLEGIENIRDSFYLLSIVKNSDDEKSSELLSNILI